MSTLTTKIQFVNYETGEFSGVRQCTFEEACAVIEQFPWEKQRHGLIVGLTCPSVIIERPDGAFLKIGAYYHDKYCLYVLTAGNQVFEKAVTTIQETLPFVKTFFAGEENTKEYTHDVVVLNPRHHFVTGSFEYSVSAKTILMHLVIPAGILGFWIYGAIAMYSSPGHYLNWVLVFFYFLILINFSGINFVLLVNYLKAARGKVLEISRGQDEFSFGDKGSVFSYNKKDLTGLMHYQASGSRNPWSGFSYVEIIFRDGKMIRIPNLMISVTALLSKFPDILPKVRRIAVPFIKER